MYFNFLKFEYIYIEIERIQFKSIKLNNKKNYFYNVFFII